MDAPDADVGTIPPGKRKKRIPPCPNPLFTYWLKLLHDDAAAKDLKTKFVYRKAINTLGKYPLPLKSGKECKMLANFGDKTCNYLDEKLAEHIRTYGSPDFVPDEVRIALKLNASTAKRQRKPAAAPPPMAVSDYAGGGNVGGGMVVFDGACAPGVTGSSHRVMSTGPHGTDQYAGLTDRADAAAATAAPTKPKRRRTSSVGYKPSPRTGPYALLITLLTQTTTERPFLTKEELMDKAQPLADKSFIRPDVIDSHYTAWSSMSTLIKKTLVHRYSNPSKYCLTAGGKQLAEHLLATTDPDERRATDKDTDLAADPTRGRQVKAGQQQNLPSFSNDEGGDTDIFGCPVTDTCTLPVTITHSYRFTSKDHSTTTASTSINTHTGTNAGTSSTSSTAPSAGIQYCYVADTGVLVRDKDQAAVQIDASIGSGGIGFLIKCKRGDLLCSKLKYAIDTTRMAKAGLIYAYLSDEHAAEHAPLTPQDFEAQFDKSKAKKKTNSVPKAKPKPALKPPPSSAVPRSLPTFSQPSPTVPLSSPNLPQSSATLPTSPSGSSADDTPDLLTRLANQNKLSHVPQDFTANKNTATGTSTNHSAASRKIANDNAACSSSSTNYTAVLPRVAQFPRLEKINSLNSDIGGVNSQSSSQSSVGDHTTATLDTIDIDYTLYPGQFDIILCVDNHEHFGSSVQGQKLLLPQLNRNHVVYDVRDMKLGDFVWIAKEKGGLGREIVTDYIIERKRMDDLSKSIIDKRFPEQKSRMHKSGLLHVIYLFESYGSTAQHCSLPEDNLYQAIVNTQIVDGFYTKRCRDYDEMITYLTLTTRYLQSLYMNKTLHCCKQSDLLSIKDRNSLSDKDHYLVSFNELNTTGVRTRVLSVSEMFAKQLYQLHGFTHEKIKAVLDLYPTLNSLFEAYDRCESEKAKENLLTAVKYGPMKRAITKLYSQKLYRYYNDMG